jgi:hypothetical protein
MSISVNCHFVTYSLHISLSPVIFNNTKGIIDSSDRFINNYPMTKLSWLSNELTYSE